MTNYCIIERDTVRVRVDLLGDTRIPEVLEAFEDCLKGCGFVLKGHVEISEEGNEEI